MNDRILEQDLQLPALYIINLYSGKITTTELLNLLRDILKPTGENLDVLDGRKDDKFSQIVRNLTAKERSFVNNGYIKRESGRNKPLFITEKGKLFLNENKEIINYLFANDFIWDDLIKSFGHINKAKENKRKIEVFDETIMIQEGIKKIVETKVYDRSSELRQKAINHYTENGDILCNACNFSYKKFYGKIGEGYIEIHHKKPIFKYEDEDLNITIEKALDNVIPVCSNCHRMIHRNWKNPLQVDYLINKIKINGKFDRVLK